VRKAHWGKGIGSLMIDTLLDWTRETRIATKVNLRVRTDNRRAIGLDLQKGFGLEGTLRQAIDINGTYYDHHYMGLDLQPAKADL
jgi:RimJ/RimL family protein N-acetyltransferase